jgi:type I restriction enzyme S subunit
MATEWPVKTIAECASPEAYSTQIGPFGKALMADQYADSGVPVLRGLNVNRGRFHDDDFVFIDDEMADRLSKFESHPGDVLLVHKGTLGQIGLMPNTRKYARYIMGNSMMRVRCDPTKLLPEYLYYWLSSSEGQHYLFSRVSQVGVPQIQTPLTTLRQAALPVPPVPEQRAIIRILAIFDDKIELNLSMNETLDAMTLEIFKSWFANFDPVRAKAAGQQPFGMDATTAALFPDAFQGSTLGDIPRGWSVSRLNEICNFAYGQALKDSSRQPGSVPVYGSNGKVGVHNTALVKGPGIVVGRKGNPGFVTWVPEDFFPIDTTFYVVPRFPVVGMRYLFHQLSLLDLPALAADSAVPGLNRNIAYMTEVIVPPEGVIEAFERLVEPMWHRVALNEQDSGTLTAARDALLPKLLSGEIRVKDVDTTVKH